jgi:hypothetical protein
VFGASGAALVRFMGGETLSAFLLVTGLCAWIVIPLVVSARLMNRQDI